MHGPLHPAKGQTAGVIDEIDTGGTQLGVVLLALFGPGGARDQVVLEVGPVPRMGSFDERKINTISETLTSPKQERPPKIRLQRVSRMIGYPTSDFSVMFDQSNNCVWHAAR